MLPILSVAILITPLKYLKVGSSHSRVTADPFLEGSHTVWPLFLQSDIQIIRYTYVISRPSQERLPAILCPTYSYSIFFALML